MLDVSAGKNSLRSLSSSIQRIARPREGFYSSNAVRRTIHDENKWSSLQHLQSLVIKEEITCHYDHK